MPDADLLRRAAAHARETAQAATSGPWKAHDTSLGHGGHTATVLTRREKPTGRSGLIAWLPTFSHVPWNDSTNAWGDAAHIALWHPVVAVTVADWLESTAAVVERHARKVNLGLVRLDRSHEPALDVARALLGEGA